MVLKGLARERLGEDALNFLAWAEEEAGGRTNTESYNNVIIALAKTNRSFHPYASSSSFQRLSGPPCTPPADMGGPAAEIDAAEAVAGVRRQIAALDAEKLGDLLAYDGNIIPY